MKILIHACCAPCLTYTYKCFKESDLTVYWFNPNIHPFKEYQERFDSMIDFIESKDIRFIHGGDYALEEFMDGALKADDRCRFCYRWRLEETARYGADNDFEAFTTTLTISPYQDHDLIQEIGDELGKKYGIEFKYRDMREGFRESHRLARSFGLYMQKYCGCIFSEEERYRS